MDVSTGAEGLLNPAMKCLAGIDEAGLGPILGPLVVTGVAMAGPAGTDPWDALTDHVAKSRPKSGQIHVADSKKVKSGPRGFEKLERTALTMWAAWRGELPDTLADWLEQIDFDVAGLATCPWYSDLDVPLPRTASRDAIELAGHLLRRDLDARRIELLRIAVRPVEVAEYNRLIAETDNKGTTHFRVYGDVLVDLLDRVPDGAHVVADRCGGRVHYRNVLAQLRAVQHVRVERERESGSVYGLRTERGTVRVTFVSRGEERAFPTALASCFAKYVRELFLERLNAWFGAAVPGLATTAGYYVDGKRFLADIATFATERGLSMQDLVRSR